MDAYNAKEVVWGPPHINSEKHIRENLATILSGAITPTILKNLHTLLVDDENQSRSGKIIEWIQENLPNCSNKEKGFYVMEIIEKLASQDYAALNQIIRKDLPDPKTEMVN